MSEKYDFKQRVLEEQLFKKLKDTPVMSADDMRTKYKNINVSRLRTKIISYQIENYGYQIFDDYRETHTKEKCNYMAEKDRIRRHRKGIVSTLARRKRG